MLVPIQGSLYQIFFRKINHESGDNKAEWDMDKVYEISKAAGKMNVELLFNKSDNARTKGHLLKLVGSWEKKKDTIMYFLNAIGSKLLQFIAREC